MSLNSFIILIIISIFSFVACCQVKNVAILCCFRLFTTKTQTRIQMIKILNKFKLTVVHFACPNPMQICAYTWIYCWTKQTVENQDWATGPPGLRASGPPGHRGPWAAGRWAFGPPGRCAAGRWAFGPPGHWAVAGRGPRACF